MREASANPEFWTDADGTGLWNDNGDWQTYYTSNRLPQYYDWVNFNAHTANMTISLGGMPSNALQSIYISGNGNGYTIGSSTSDGNVVLVDGWAIAQQANLAGNGKGTTFNSAIEMQGYDAVNNFSPDSQITTVPGISGYNNPLTLAGGIIKDNGARTDFFGIGDIVVSGDYVATHGGDLNSDMAAGSLVLSGTNNITNSNVRLGGGAVLDYTTNNTLKLPTTTNVSIGNAFTNFNGNVAANGGHLVIDANQSAETDVTFGSTSYQGSSSLVVNGASDGVTPTVINFNGLGTNTYGGSFDITTTGNVSLYTTNTNAGTYGEQTLIMNQQITIDKSYFAQAGGNTYAQNGSGGYGYNSTPVLITPLVNDNGTSFNTDPGYIGYKKYGEFHVAAEASDVQTLTPDAANGNSEGADTFRFTSANDPLGGVTSAHTLDLGGGNFYMDYGGIMVTQAVMGDTTVRNGTIYSGINGLSIINYSSGTLNISANLAPNAFGIDGGGTVNLSGNNEAGTNDQIVSVNNGKLILGSSTAIGSGNQLDMGSATAVLDLNGNSISVARLLSDSDYTPGNAAAAAGLNSNIENTKAGTVSVLQIAGIPAGNVDDSNVSTTNIYTDNNLGQYYGGLNEVSGSIISLDIEQGTSTHEVQFILGSANPFGDASGANSSNLSGVQGPATNITGAIVIGANANLGLVGYGNIETMGVTNLNGLLGPEAQQAANYGTTYLTGTGHLVGGNGWGFGLATVGSVADTFNGTFGTSSVGTAFALQVGGTGTVNLTNAYYGNNGLTVSQDATLNMPTIADGANATATAHGTLVITSPTAAMNSNFYLNGGGTIEIAPTGVGQAVTVTNSSGYIGNNNGGSLILNAGQNTSLTYEMGNQNNQAHFEFFYDNSFTLGVTQGLAALGNTTQFLVQSNSAIMGQNYQTNLPNNIVGTSFYAQDDSAGSPENATFLQINNTATANVYSLTPYAYDAAHTNNLNAAGLNDIELVTAGTTYTYTQGSFDPILGLQVDKGAVIQNNGYLTLGNYNTGFSGLILNGGKIMGNGLNLYRATAVYTDLDGGEIQNFNINGQDLTKNGPGTLVIDTAGNLGYTTINQGVLDLSGLSNSSGAIILNGGVLQTSSDITRTLGNQTGDVNLGTGGFAARQATPGGYITITLADASGSQNLVWGVGGTSYFLGEQGTLDFGSSTANSAILFASNINLGLPEGGSSGQQALYTRVINVTAANADSGDPLAYNDSVSLEGTISASDPYVGLTKAGDGTLFLTGVNTYKGATMISGGELAITADSGLGTAPTSAYALNSTPGVSGNALTPGAVEINGGASLGVISPDGNPVTLSSNRQMLLASGTAGATAAIINVAGSAAYGGYTELDFGGVIADYVGEVGSLQKTGGGTFNYSGTAYNTGSYAVTAGTLTVSGSGSINSANGVTINNNSTDPNAIAQFNYASTVGLSRQVTYGTGGGTFAYNSGAVYTGSTSLTVGAKDVLAGGVNLNGNLSLTNVTIGTGGTITPGALDPAVGQLTVGALSFVQGGNYNFLLQNAWEPAGTGYSTVAATSLDLTGLSMAIPFNINLDSLVNPQGTPADRFYFYQPYTFTLVSTTAGITGFNGNDFVVNTAPTDGTTGFAPNMGGMWEVVESANGDNLLLKYTPTEAPEPATWAMLFGGLGLLAFIRRLRSRSASVVPSALD